jgi:hypothetical protein
MTRDRATARYQNKYFGKKAVAKISSATGLTISPEQSDELEETAAVYFAVKSRKGKLPPSKIEEHLQRLKDLYADIAAVIAADMPLELEMELGDGFIDGLESQQLAIDVALKGVIVGKSGRRTDHALVFLIFELSEMYDQLAGETEKLVKNKVDFLDVCLRGIGIELSTSQIRHRYREGQE